MVTPPPPLPYSWNNKHFLEHNHFAAMHMMFLGHVKSNYDMTQKWLATYEISATFGKQANKYLFDIQQLRCNHFFDAHPLSTSKWGTGVWVSENYLFWGRTQKFFATLPAIHSSKHAGSNPQYDAEIGMIIRFASPCLSALSRIMSENRGTGDMDAVIKIYMGSMVELDRWIMSAKLAEDFGDEASAGTNVTPATIPLPSTDDANITGTTSKRKRTGFGKKKEPNFCKSNSLGILAAPFMHWYLGPAKLHWEGSWFGERKIQPAKREMSIERSTADWQSIVLSTLWQQDTIAVLLDKMCGSADDPNRALDGKIRVYKNKETLLAAITACKPMVGLLANDDGLLWLAYRPTTEEFYANAAVNSSLQGNWSCSSV